MNRIIFYVEIFNKEHTRYVSVLYLPINPTGLKSFRFTSNDGKTWLDIGVKNIKYDIKDQAFCVYLEDMSGIESHDVLIAVDFIKYSDLVNSINVDKNSLI